LRPKFLDKKIMSISPIFMFAPVPLTNERSPLAHAAAIVRRRLAKKKAVDAALV
jgi:hypothetical protein